MGVRGAEMPPVLSKIPRPDLLVFWKMPGPFLGLGDLWEFYERFRRVSDELF